ncbi:trehalose 6-phosphate phosphatase [Aliidongia dinghuensis]|uniref:Trehalose 6-phosphate phosphatase n=1 Tax=Aliidongia dinghuensis TaxID=1867774 RepID=A0A8J2YWY5_9PROT|nr:trehalose-phosphatase [Aliidongia dinghuensis]GGF33942.1 trehalose 6-phosphate phosphatase [Aliidongia dinghuensis]
MAWEPALESSIDLSPPPARPGWSYFLDFDGTLVDFARTPGEVSVDARLRALLDAVHRAVHGALAIVSGRPLVELDQFLALPHLPMAGQHGLEWRDAFGCVARVPRLSLSPHIVQAARHWAAERPGALAEVKDFSVALHVRGNPPLLPEALAFGQQLVASDPSRLMLQPGAFVVEIRCRGGNKGDIVDRFLRDRPFLGRRPVFIGDDLTDEYGFIAAARGGGFGVRVGEPRETSARHRLLDPAAVRTWLGPLAAADQGTH